MFYFLFAPSANTTTFISKVEASFTFCKVRIRSLKTLLLPPSRPEIGSFEKLMASATFFVSLAASQFGMLQRMLFLIIAQFKVFDCVIQSTSIFVVYLFSLSQGSSKVFRHQISMLRYFFAIHINNFIAMRYVPSFTFICNQIKAAIRILTHVMFIAQSFRSNWLAALRDGANTHFRIILLNLSTINL